MIYVPYDEEKVRPIPQKGNEMKPVSWPQVTMILATIALLVLGVCFLAALDKDPTIMLTLAGLIAVPVLGAFGVAVYQKLDQVKEVSNGTLTRAHDMIDKQAGHAADAANQAAVALAANNEILAKVVQLLTEQQHQRNLHDDAERTSSLR